MPQNQSSLFGLPIFYPFGSSSLFSPAKPKIWLAIWPLAGRYFEPCATLENTLPLHNCRIVFQMISFRLHQTHILVYQFL